MADDLDGFAEWIGAYTARLEPDARRALARGIAAQLRASQSARITAQTNPDGSPFAPRKRQKYLRGRAGALKKGPMFRKLRLARFLKVLEASGEQVAVGYDGGVAPIARVHQEGLRDKVTKAANATVVQYPARRLLGFTRADEDALAAAVLAFVEARG